MNVTCHNHVTAIPSSDSEVLKCLSPAPVRAEFEQINGATTDENDYYGAYNLLLCHAFPMESGYIVHPQVSPVDSERGAVDFVVYFRQELHRVPVFFVKIKTAAAIRNISIRAAADDQMRLMLKQLYDQSLSELHGVSALGTRVCFYRLDKSTRTIDPSCILPDTEYVTDTAPADRWDADILTDDGYDRFMCHVHYVGALAGVEVT